MSRNKGNLSISANWEPQKAAPFDARSIVQLKSDLTDINTWKALDNNVWTYVGMTVVVTNDTSNNGVYVLSSSDYTNIANWTKISDEAPVDGKTYVKKDGMWVELASTFATEYYEQTVNNSDHWIINHTLSIAKPNVTIVDFGGSIIEADVRYINEHEIHIFFTTNFSGKVILS